MTDRRALLKAKGVNGQLELFDALVRINRRGLQTFISRGANGDKDIPIPDISSVQFKKAAFPINGHIRFICAGQKADVRSIYAPWDENTVLFNWYQQQQFQDIKKAIEAKLRRQSV